MHYSIHVACTSHLLLLNKLQKTQGLKIKYICYLTIFFFRFVPLGMIQRSPLCKVSQGCDQSIKQAASLWGTAGPLSSFFGCSQYLFPPCSCRMVVSLSCTLSIRDASHLLGAPHSFLPHDVPHACENVFADAWASHFKAFYLIKSGPLRIIYLLIISKSTDLWP